MIAVGKMMAWSVPKYKENQIAKTTNIEFTVPNGSVLPYHYLKPHTKKYASMSISLKHNPIADPLCASLVINRIKLNQQMNAKVFINENFVALPKYNFGARRFETKQEQIILSLLTCGHNV